MNNRDKFREIMRGGALERVPLLEEGIRDKVIDTWRSAGGLSHSADLNKIFHFDQRKEIYTELEHELNLLELSSLSDGLEKLKRELDPGNPAYLPEGWQENLSSWKVCQEILMLRVHRGFFLTLGVEDAASFNDMIYLLMDNPDFVRQALLIQGIFAAQMAEIVLQEVEVDAAIFSEPIGNNSGPLISPAMYREFMLPSLQPVLETLKRYNVETIIFRTYANTRILLPLFIEAGMNCLWAVERGTDDMDYLDLRREYKSDLRLIAGIDRDVLRLGKQQIRAELDSCVPPLLESGGYLPLVDGRIREDIPFENYIYYRENLEELTGYRETK